MIPSMNRMLPFLLSLLLLSAGAVAAAPLPRGKVIDKVVCTHQPDQAYALYLPSTYTPERKWPVLYAFDARGQGKTVAKLFQQAAETYGWIVVSSWSSASDVAGDRPMEGNFAIMRALWADTHAGLSIDDRRVYAAGYSGTVRFACLLGLTAPGSIAGVIGASAGFPIGTQPKKDNPFVFFGTYGDHDFNYYELRDLDQALGAVAVPHRIEGFAGSHEWPPVELATRAVGWMELQAMKKGLREKSPSVIEAEWSADRERAKAQAAAHPADAFHTWSAMAADYAGLRDVSEAEKEAAALSASPACQKELRDREARDRRDKALLADAPGILANTNPGNDPVTVAQIAAALKIPELKKRAESADAEESLSAQRILNMYAGQLAFYQPQALLAKKEYDRAIFMMSVAAEIHPDDPDLWVGMASVYASKGKSGTKKALESLRTAVDKGFTDRKYLDKEPAFADLRKEPEFAEIMARMPAAPVQVPPPAPAPVSEDAALQGMKLLPGYKHVREQGIDSSVGRIVKGDRTVIRYDIGPMAGLQVTPEDKKFCSSYQEMDVEGQTMRVCLQGHSFKVTFVEAQANFSGEAQDDGELVSLIEMLKTFRGPHRVRPQR
jgi:poly(3-hydroxybutyrate) depolymerase